MFKSTESKVSLVVIICASLVTYIQFSWGNTYGIHGVDSSIVFGFAHIGVFWTTVLVGYTLIYFVYLVYKFTQGLLRKK